MRACTIALGFALLLPTRARAEEPLAIAVLATSQGSAQPLPLASPPTLPSPVLTPAQLAARLGVVAPAPLEEVEALAQSYDDAVDHFYAGRDRRADEGLAELITTLHARPELTFVLPALRHKGFGALLHRAEIARANRDEAAVTRHIEEAATRFPGLVPEAREFPPWLRERHRLAAATAPAPLEIALNTSPGCELLVDGEPVGVGPKQWVKLSRGLHAGRARCGGPLGPVRVFEVTTPRMEEALLGLRHAELRLDGPIALLVLDSRASQDDARKDAVLVSRAASLPRIVLAHEEQLALLDANSGKVLRTSTLALAASLAQETREPAAPPAPREDHQRRRPWYADGAAIAFLGVGVASFTTGFVLAQTRGQPSTTEPLAWALLAGGVGSAATGVVLFLVPNTQSGQDSVSAGVAMCTAF